MYDRDRSTRDGIRIIKIRDLINRMVGGRLIPISSITLDFLPIYCSRVLTNGVNLSEGRCDFLVWSEDFNGM